MATKLTLESIRKILAGAARSMATPVRVTPLTADEYFRHLSDLSEETLKASIDYCIQNVSDFFPTVRQIRDAMQELMVITVGIPSAAEAWAMVNKAKTYVNVHFCETGGALRDAIAGKIDAEYRAAQRAYNEHVDQCTECHWNPRSEYHFDHPAVAMVFRQLGGYNGVFTDNPTADRARWIDAYRLIVEREVEIATHSPSIKSYIEAQRAAYELQPPKAIALLASKLGNEKVLHESAADSH